MKQKPIVCLIDEDDKVKRGWEQALGVDALLQYYPDHLELFNHSAREKDLIKNFSCVIIGRHFKQLNLDVVSSNVPDNLKSAGAGPIFLNWQGYITKDEVNSKFDGKLFHRYGVKWQTLRLRIQKFEKTQKFPTEKMPITEKYARVYENKCKETATASRPEKCSALLKEMASKADGIHREKIEFYAYRDVVSGRQLLEAIYNRLLTDKNRPETCPSRYINSSPVIAQRILHNALYG